MLAPYNASWINTGQNNMLSLLTNQIPDVEQLTSLIERTEILNQTRFYYFCKDLNGNYLNANDLMIKEIGFSKESELLGLNDFDLCWNDYAEQFRENDQFVIKTNQFKMGFEKTKSINDIVSDFFYFKLPLKRNSKKIIGSIGLSFCLNNVSLFTSLINLKESRFENNALNKIEDHSMSQRQLDCLYYLTQGMTMKEIAKKLELSPRTIEQHVKDIRNKLNCTSRSALISKALTLRAIRERLNI